MIIMTKYINNTRK